LQRRRSRGDKSPVPEHRKGPAGLEEEDSDGWPHGRIEKAAPLRKALGKKEEQKDRGREATAQAPQARASIRFRAEKAVIAFIAQIDPVTMRGVDPGCTNGKKAGLGPNASSQVIDILERQYFTGLQGRLT
jgi:hypothetical protein